MQGKIIVVLPLLCLALSSVIEPAPQPRLEFLSQGIHDYAYRGESGWDDDVLYCQIPPERNTGEMIYSNQTFLYGNYSWDGLYHPSTTGYSLAGFFDVTTPDGTTCYYCIFEFRWEGETKQFLSQTYGLKEDCDDFSSSFFSLSLDCTVWHHYKVDWRPGMVRFYVDGDLVATHTVCVPDIELHFGLKAGVPSWEEAPADWSGVAIKNFRRI